MFRFRFPYLFVQFSSHNYGVLVAKTTRHPLYSVASARNPRRAFVAGLYARNITSLCNLIANENVCTNGLVVPNCSANLWDNSWRGSGRCSTIYRCIVVPSKNHSCQNYSWYERTLWTTVGGRGDCVWDRDVFLFVQGPSPQAYTGRMVVYYADIVSCQVSANWMTEGDWGHHSI